MKNITFTCELPKDVQEEATNLIEERMLKDGYTQTDIDYALISFLENKWKDVVVEEFYITEEDSKQILIGYLLKVNY